MSLNIPYDAARAQQTCRELLTARERGGLTPGQVDRLWHVAQRVNASSPAIDDNEQAMREMLHEARQADPRCELNDPAKTAHDILEVRASRAAARVQGTFSQHPSQALRLEFAAPLSRQAPDSPPTR